MCINKLGIKLNQLNKNAKCQLTIFIIAGFAPSGHRAHVPTVGAPCGQGDGCNRLGQLHRMEELDQHDVVIQSLIVVAMHKDAWQKVWPFELTEWKNLTMPELYKVSRNLWSVTNSLNSLLVPDDGVSLHELLRALKHSHIVFSQKDLHGVGAWEKNDQWNISRFWQVSSSISKSSCLLVFLTGSDVTDVLHICCWTEVRNWSSAYRCYFF